MVNEINIGITGASGFIGSSLIKHFKQKVQNIIIIKSRLENFEKLSKEINSLPKLDFVIHLAGSFQGKWEELCANNFTATKNLLSCLNPENTKVLFTSTGSVYGNSGEIGVNESFECSPVDDYGQIKLMTEKIICEYGNYLIYRLPSVYGLGNKKGVIYHWINAVNSEEKLKVGDQGLSHRSFLSIKDLLSVFDISISKNIQGIYNLSENKYFSMIELARIISKDKKDNIDFFKSNNLLKSMVLKNDKFCKETNFIFSNLINYLDEN